MLKKIILIIAGIVFLTGSAGITVQNDGYKKQKSKMESFDAIDNKYHIDGEGFYYVGKMLKKRAGHTATLLQDGRVFIAGGSYSDSYDGSRTTEIFDLKTGTSVPGPDMFQARYDHQAFLMKDGRVLIYGNPYRNDREKTSIEIFDPKTNRIKVVGEFPRGYYFGRENNFIDYLTDDEVVFGDSSGLFILNTKSDIIRFIDLKDDRTLGFRYYVGRVNNIFYFTNGYWIDKMVYKGNDKFEAVPFDSKANGTLGLGEEFSILLKDKKHILMLVQHRPAIFNIETEKYSYAPVGFGIRLPKDESKLLPPAYLLSDGNVWVFMFNKDDSMYLSNLAEVAVKDEKIRVIYKRYRTPGMWATTTDLGNDRILYSGGGKMPFGLKHYDTTDKVYVWRRKEDKHDK